MNGDQLAGIEIHSLIVWLTVSAVITCVGLFIVNKLVRLAHIPLIKQNFLGNDVPVIGGIAFIAIGFLMMWLMPEPPYSVVLIGFGVFGLIDDLFGNRSAGGFRGHINALTLNKTVTTGLIKAIGGGLVALVTAYWIHIRPQELIQGYSDRPEVSLPTLILFIPIIGAFIALMANSINLLDVRPGRSVTVAFTLLFLAMIKLNHWGFTPMICFGALIPIMILDKRAKIMLGDCGSNALGALIALVYVAILPFWAIGIATALLLAFHIWTEKHSLNKLIEETPWLRAIDRKIGVR